jgi:hypothetical protein
MYFLVLNYVFWCILLQILFYFTTTYDVLHNIYFLFSLVYFILYLILFYSIIYFTTSTYNICHFFLILSDNIFIWWLCCRWAGAGLPQGTQGGGAITPPPPRGGGGASSGGPHCTKSRRRSASNRWIHHPHGELMNWQWGKVTFNWCRWGTYWCSPIMSICLYFWTILWSDGHPYDDSTIPASLKGKSSQR